MRTFIHAFVDVFQAEFPALIAAKNRPVDVETPSERRTGYGRKSGPVGVNFQVTVHCEKLGDEKCEEKRLHVDYSPPITAHRHVNVMSIVKEFSWDAG